MLKCLLAASVVLLTPPAVARVPRLTLQSIPGPDGGWDYVSFDSTTGRVYVGRSDGVSVLDTRTNTVRGVPLPAQRFHGVQPLAGGRVIATASRPSLAFLIDEQGKVLAQIPVRVKADAVLLEPRTGLVAVMDNENGLISLLNPLTGALDPATGRLYLPTADFTAVTAPGQRPQPVSGSFRFLVVDTR